MDLTIDTYGWVEVLRSTSTGRKVVQLIQESETCFTSAISLVEVADILVREEGDGRRIRSELELIAGASEVVGIDQRLAEVAAEAAQELRARAKERHLPRPGIADGAILATARLRSTRLVTGDPHFKDLPETLWLD